MTNSISPDPWEEQTNGDKLPSKDRRLLRQIKAIPTLAKEDLLKSFIRLNACSDLIEKYGARFSDSELIEIVMDMRWTLTCIRDCTEAVDRPLAVLFNANRTD